MYISIHPRIYRAQAGVAGAPVASATPSAAVPERKDVMELAKMLGGKVCRHGGWGMGDFVYV